MFDVLIKWMLLFFLVISSTCYAEIRAMSINTQWLWTPFDHKVDGNFKHIRDMSQRDYLEELNFYAEHIQARNIDVVALSEIENEQVANELVERLNESMSDKWKAYFKQGRDTATGQDVAIISKLPYVEGSLTDFNFPSGFIAGAGKAKRLSKIVGAQFWLQGKIGKHKVGVITAHLLSKRNDSKKKATNRQKQALGVKKAVDQFRQVSDALIVLGDFNDFINSSTLAIILDKQLKTYKDCNNFAKKLTINDTKKWQRNIDHLLYSGFDCKGQYSLDLQHHSDHPAIYGKFALSQSK